MNQYFLTLNLRKQKGDPLDISEKVRKLRSIVTSTFRAEVPISSPGPTYIWQAITCFKRVPSVANCIYLSNN